MNMAKNINRLPITISTMIVLSVSLLLGGCGTLTGLPGHGGGKRFAVEQELVAAATRGAIKQIDLSTIRGKKVNLFVNAIGDTGAGNLTGGRFSIASQLRGDYLQTPVTTENSVFPRYTSTTTAKSTSKTSSDSDTSSEQDPVTTTSFGGTSVTGPTTSSSSTDGSSSSSTSSNTTTDTLLPYPETKTSQQKGSGGVAQVGMKYEGLGAYLNSDQIPSNDLQYLSALLQTYLFLQGVYVVPPSEAEIDVYITVDVFGTVRTRIEWFLANNEILRAKTSFEVLAIDSSNGHLVMPPQAASAEAEYNEQFILWAGPIIIKKTMIKSEPLLCDFTDLKEKKDVITQPAEQNEPIPYPFRYQMEKWMKKK